MKNFQQMMNKALVVQKKMENFKKEEFLIPEEQNGAIKIKITGNYQFTLLDIDYAKLMTNYENDQETINAIIQIAINDAIKFVKKKEAAIVSV